MFNAEILRIDEQIPKEAIGFQKKIHVGLKLSILLCIIYKDTKVADMFLHCKKTLCKL